MKIIERFFTKPVAGQEQCPGVRVPDGKGEHAAEVVQASCAPFTVSLEDYLGVRVAVEADAMGFQFRANFSKIVDLTVVDDPVPSITVLHRLVAGEREIEDGETPIAEKDGGRLRTALTYHVPSGIVRTPMREPGQSLQQALFTNLVWGTNGSQDATHDSPTYFSITRCPRPRDAHTNTSRVAREVSLQASDFDHRSSNCKAGERHGQIRLTRKSPLDSQARSGRREIVCT